MNIILKNAVSSDFIEKIDVSSSKLVSISIEGQSSVTGLKSTYKATGHYDNDTAIDLTNIVNWSIESGTSYAEIAKGELSILPSASSQQAITIKAEYNGIYGTKSVNVTYDLGIDEFTKSAILSSGNSFNDSQTLAIDSFFKAIGATEGTGIWSKLKRVYLPVLSKDVSKAVFNYKTNTNDSPDINAEYWGLRSRGLVPIKDIDSASHAILISESENNNILDYSCFAFNTEDLVNRKKTYSTIVYSNYMLPGLSDSNYVIYTTIGLTGSEGNIQNILVRGSHNSAGDFGVNTVGQSYAETYSKGLRGVSIYNNKAKGLFCNNVDDSSPIIEKDVDESKLVSNKNDRGKAFIMTGAAGILTGYEEITPMGMIFLGTHLEDSEIITLQNETKKLYDKLVE